MVSDFSSDLGFANTKSRLRMVTLYQIAASNNGIVVGTGNKVEDFGVGFYTKYGDGGVDISPIADLYKTEVRELGRYLDIPQEIINATPTDGLCVITSYSIHYTKLYDTRSNNSYFHIISFSFKSKIGIGTIL